MNPTRRIKRSFYKTIGGIDMCIETCVETGYSGREESSGFDIRIGGKKIGFFYGYPTDKDLTYVLNRELSHEN